jgi:SH3-like domain-containing protein
MVLAILRKFGDWMEKVVIRLGILSLLLLAGLTVLNAPQAAAKELAQQPTVAIPTVTGTPLGPLIRVNADNDYINVRAGPNTDYAAIGVLIAGERVSAYAKIASGAWIQIAYPGVEGGIGWVHSNLVTLISGGDLPIAEPPPTATPRVTWTIDPTLAAEYINEVQPTRLPTYTPPPPLVVSTFEPTTSGTAGGGFPIGLVIVLLGAVGILGALFALIRGR